MAVDNPSPSRGPANRLLERVVHPHPPLSYTDVVRTSLVDIHGSHIGLLVQNGPLGVGKDLLV